MAADTTPITETTTTKKELTLDEISKHQSHDDCWLIIGNQSNGMFLKSYFILDHTKTILLRYGPHFYCMTFIFVLFFT
jgi:hypothetical protein